VLAASLADAGCDSFVAEPAGLKAYVPTALYDDSRVRAVVEGLPFADTDVSYTATAVADQDWNATWEAEGFEPIVIGDRIVIHDEDATDYPPARIDIAIHPRQAFGTGTHATTRLMLRQLLDANLDGATVIDAGCGTGILGILCAMRGASAVMAYDIDEWSVSNAQHNYDINHRRHPDSFWPVVDIEHGDASCLATAPQADIILANINRNILLADMPAFARRLKPGGKLMVSGFLAEDITMLTEAAAAQGLRLMRQASDGEWQLLLFKQPNTDQRLLQLLSQSFPNIATASTEIINLEAIQNLPKGTEHFMADIHGEYEAFLHILKNASGRIKRKVRELFADTLTDEQQRDLCTLIYYPEQKLEIIKNSRSDDLDDLHPANGVGEAPVSDIDRQSSLNAFYATTLRQLTRVLQTVSSKYTRSKVRKALPSEFAYIIEELLHESPSDHDKEAYFSAIIDSIIETDRADAFIVAIASVIQRLAVDQLHILGDIFDRGPGAHIIMDRLCQLSAWDIQWGNHDALWMGAAAGNDCCIANVLRLSLRYGNMATLEDGYGINLVPLATFAMDTYADDPCDLFGPRLDKDDTTHNEKTRRLIAQMHKAISIIQFKLEAQMILRRPQWGMHNRLVLQNIDLKRGVYVCDGREYEMKDTFLPTLDPRHPFELTAEEAELVRQLHHSFRVSDKLQKHIKCLFTHGCMYAVTNGNLLFHASVPLNADGTLKAVDIDGHSYSGRELLHHIGITMRAAFNADTPRAEKSFARDYFWYLWCGPDSPLFDKDRMATFERYFLCDKATHEERKGNYYLLRDNADVCDRILDAFGVSGHHRHIINGHVPVRVAGGESPIKAGGRLMVIDGGLSKAYHDTTGIAGYTLVFHSRGFELIQHEPFRSADDAIRRGTDIVSSKQIVELSGRRIRVRDTDKGRQLQDQIDELQELLYAYRHGTIKERLSAAK